MSQPLYEYNVAESEFSSISEDSGTAIVGTDVEAYCWMTVTVGDPPAIPITSVAFQRVKSGVIETVDILDGSWSAASPNTVVLGNESGIFIAFFTIAGSTVNVALYKLIPEDGLKLIDASVVTYSTGTSDGICGMTWCGDTQTDPDLAILMHHNGTVKIYKVDPANGNVRGGYPQTLTYPGSGAIVVRDTTSIAYCRDGFIYFFAYVGPSSAVTKAGIVGYKLGVASIADSHVLVDLTTPTNSFGFTSVDWGVVNDEMGDWSHIVTFNCNPLDVRERQVLISEITGSTVTVDVDAAFLRPATATGKPAFGARGMDEGFVYVGGIYYDDGDPDNIVSNPALFQFSTAGALADTILSEDVTSDGLTWRSPGQTGQGFVDPSGAWARTQLRSLPK